jgi:hypothetical protein
MRKLFNLRREREEKRKLNEMKEEQDDRTTGRPDDRTTGRQDDRTTGRQDDGTKMNRERRRESNK